jgi:hypothetical protein
MKSDTYLSVSLGKLKKDNISSSELLLKQLTASHVLGITAWEN